MEHISVINYNDIKEELINRIIELTSNCNHDNVVLSLQANPDEQRLIINDITYRGYYNPYEVILNHFDEVHEDAVVRYITTIKDIADVLDKDMKELIQEVACQPVYIGWMDPIDVTWEDVHNYVYSKDEYAAILDDMYAEHVKTDCIEFIKDEADRLLEDAIEFMERKYDCKLEVIK